MQLVPDRPWSFQRGEQVTVRWSRPDELVGPFSASLDSGASSTSLAFTVSNDLLTFTIDPAMAPGDYELVLHRTVGLQVPCTSDTIVNASEAPNRALVKQPVTIVP